LVCADEEKTKLQNSVAVINRLVDVRMMPL